LQRGPIFDDKLGRRPPAFNFMKSLRSSGAD
jgi:hypothetical protein